MPANRPMIPMSAAAAIAGVSEASFRRWHRAGDLPDGLILTLGGRLYVRRRALIAWCEQVAADPDQQPDALRLVKASER